MRPWPGKLQRLLAMAEYVCNQPEISEESKAGLHHLKLDLVAGSNFAWRTVHNNMLMHCSVAMENLSRTIPLIDLDKKVALLHAPFKSTTLFRGDLAKLHSVNKKRLFIRQHPLRPTPLSLTQSVAGLVGRVAPPTGEVAGIEITVDPPRATATTIKPSKSGRFNPVKPP